MGGWRGGGMYGSLGQLSLSSSRQDEHAHFCFPAGPHPPAQINRPGDRQSSQIPILVLGDPTEIRFCQIGKTTRRLLGALGNRVFVKHTKTGQCLHFLNTCFRSCHTFVKTKMCVSKLSLGVGADGVLGIPFQNRSTIYRFGQRF